MSNRMQRLVTDRRFPRYPVTLHRPIYSGGPEGEEEITFEDPANYTLTVQPASTDDLDLLPEGQRLENIVAVWSTVELFVADGKTRDSDVLEIGGAYNGRKFTVVKRIARDTYGYWKVLAEGFVSA